MTSRPQPATVPRLGQSASGPSRHLAERERLHGESDGRRVLSTSLPRSAIPAEPSIRESRPVPPGPLKSISLSKAAPASNPLPAKPPSSSHYAASFGPSQKPAPSTSCSPPGPVYHERPQKHASTSDSHLSARSTANGTCQDYNQLYNKPWPKLEGNWMNVDNSELSISVIKHAPTSSSNGNRKRRYNGHGLSLPLSDPRKDPQRMQKVAARDLPPVKNVPQLEKITYTAGVFSTR